MRQILLFVVFALSASATASAQARLVITPEAVLAKAGPVKKRNLPMPVCGPGTTPRIHESISNDAGVERVRLEFSGAIPTDGWSIEFVSIDTDTRWTIGAAAVAERLTAWRESSPQGNLVLWSGAVRGGGKAVEITRERADAQCPTVTVTGQSIEAVQSSPSSVNKPDDLKPYLEQKNAWPTPAVAEWSTAIARIRFVSDADGLPYFCTGFLVTPRLLLTNHHCLGTESRAQSAQVDFDYDREGGSAATIDVKTLVHANEGLDYALVQLEQPTTRKPLTMAAARVLGSTDGGKTPSKATLVIVQHPSGKAKHASIVDCRALAVDVPGVTASASDFEHRCDTEGGSSGSPVHQMPGGLVVGLHHWGQPENDPGENQAVKIVDVLNHLRGQLSQLPSRHSHLVPEIKKVIEDALARK